MGNIRVWRSALRLFEVPPDVDKQSHGCYNKNNLIKRSIPMLTERPTEEMIAEWQEIHRTHRP
ncbi:MAG: hypothetical protein IKK51_03170, partial [Oscillospiraceae bacterium]|nr:hypothetical protein [Oscillospiraceae bacterium]